MCESTKKKELVATDFNYEVVATEPPLPTMTDNGGGSYMPSWNGNPFEFEDYKIGCERLVDGTKDEVRSKLFQAWKDKLDEVEA